MKLPCLFGNYERSTNQITDGHEVSQRSYTCNKLFTCFYIAFDETFRHYLSQIPRLHKIRPQIIVKDKGHVPILKRTLHHIDRLSQSKELTRSKKMQLDLQRIAAIMYIINLFHISLYIISHCLFYVLFLNRPPFKLASSL